MKILQHTTRLKAIASIILLIATYAMIQPHLNPIVDKNVDCMYVLGLIAIYKSKFNPVKMEANNINNHFVKAVVINHFVSKGQVIVVVQHCQKVGDKIHCMVGSKGGAIRNLNLMLKEATKYEPQEIIFQLDGLNVTEKEFAASVNTKQVLNY